MLEMSDRDKFLFDVQGFLVVQGSCPKIEVERLNAAVDANRDRIRDDRNAHTDGSQTLAGSGKRQTLNDLLTLEPPWCQPFRDLLVHPKLVPYLNTMLGPGWRMDHAPQMFFAEPGAEGLALHGAGAGVAEIWDRDHPGFGGRAPDMARTYQYANGQMRCGLRSAPARDAAVARTPRAAHPAVPLLTPLPPLRGRVQPDGAAELGLGADRAATGRPRTAVCLRPPGDLRRRPRRQDRIGFRQGPDRAGAGSTMMSCVGVKGLQK